MKSCIALLATVALLACGPLSAAPLDALHSSCFVSAGEQPGKLRLRITNERCDDDRNCGSNFSDESSNRLSGVNAGDLSREGAQLTAALNAEAGVFTCAGTVHDGTLAGTSTFTPSQAFV